MPFTFSHAAAVLPLRRPLVRVQLFTAAVIGSMVPDFGVLLPVHLTRTETHSLPALLYFCLPVGLISWSFVMLVVRPAALAVCPDRAYARLRSGLVRVRWSSPWTWIGAALALLTGALTHLVWDGFTHENARYVRMFPLLDELTPDVAGHPMRLYHWLQYSSSVLGLSLVLLGMGLWWWHAPRVEPPPRQLAARERHAWLVLYVLGPVLAMLHQAWFVYGPRHGHFSLASGINREGLALMQGTAAAVVGVSLLIVMRLLAQGRGATPLAAG